jgi:hypothetical protein
MTIDLMVLAKKADETYLDVETSFGTLRIYHVPDALLLSVGPNRPEPELPMIRMKTTTGWQDRQAKPGDEQYEAWQVDKAAYEQESYQLRIAIGAVSALKDIDWSQYDLSKPPPVASAQEMYNGCWPEHELLRKKAWLDWTILFKRSDQTAILNAMNQMNGESEPTEEMVEEAKKNSVLSSKRSQKA